MCGEIVDPGVSKIAERPDQTPEARQPLLQTTLADLLVEHLTRRAAQTFPHHAPDE